VYIPANANQDAAMKSRQRVAVLGAGISGLTAAFALQRAGHHVEVFEAGNHPGGVMRTHREDGWLVEQGPNTVMMRSTKIKELITQLNLGEEWLEAKDTAKKRFIVKDGKPEPLPGSLMEAIQTPLFSWSAKLGILGEPFRSKWQGPTEESLAHFVERRLGQEFLDYAINPFVAGVYAGDPAQLSVKHAFSKMYDLEQNYGSLIGGAILGAKERKNRPDRPEDGVKMFSFEHGLDTLPKKLADRLGDQLHLQHLVKRVESHPEGYRITTAHDAQTETHTFDRVISTIPPHRIQEVEWQLEHADLFPVLNEITFPPVTSLSLGFRREAVAHPLDGFGMLVPEKEPFKILGALFVSSIFEHRAPEGHVLITVFMGGARYPSLAQEPEAQIRKTALRDLDTLLDISEEPVFEKCSRWPHAIPQYEVGYGRYKELMETIERGNSGFEFLGNYKNGIAVPDCIVAGLEVE
jgi:oxygen-dependent protoporphyrinogen oxidase